MRAEDSMRRVFVTVLFCLIVAASLPPAPVEAQVTESRYLSGTDKDHTVPWEFMVSDGRRRGEWATIPVPSNWEMHGFGTYTYGQEKNKTVEEGRYRHRFDVPAAWKDRRLFLVFEGSMTDTSVSVNGRPAGPVHRGGFYEFRREITPLVRAGRSNLLDITVCEHSSNASVNRAERDGDFWVLGGIYRPVRLEAVPQTYIERVAIDARADGAFSAVVHLDGTLPAARLTGRLETLDGTPVGAPFATEVAPGQATVTLTTRADAPRTWSAETPRLYRAT
jgi:beta-galactosidase/beta-glucuronidase